MPDDGTLERWFRLEMAEVQRALVARPIPLNELLGSQRPHATTRGGEPYPFDPVVLRRLASQLSALARAELRLPCLFYLDRGAPGNCFVSDPGQASALRGLGLVKTEPREGRAWLSEPLAREFGRGHPGLAQFVFL
jgi:uncharacterized protein (UPF0216 family)